MKKRLYNPEYGPTMSGMTELNALLLGRGLLRMINQVRASSLDILVWRRNLDQPKPRKGG